MIKKLLFASACLLLPGASAFSNQTELEAILGELDQHLAAHPGDDQARFLRAMIRLGVTGERRLPEFLTSVGATTAEIDLVHEVFEVEFDEDHLVEYGEGNVWTPLADGWHLDTGSSGDRYYLSYWNKGGEPAELVLDVGHGALGGEVEDDYFGINVYFRGDYAGWLFTSYPSTGGVTYGSLIDDGSFEGFQQDWSGLEDPDRGFGQLAVTLQPGDWVSFELDWATAGLIVYPAEPVSAEVQALTGRVPLHAEYWPRFDSGTTLGDFVRFAGGLTDEALGLALDDLSLIGPGAWFFLDPEEGGTADNVIVEYADVRFLMGMLKGVQATTLLARNYDLELGLWGSNLREYEESLSNALAGNPDLLKPSAHDNPGEREQARLLLKEAIDHYLEVEARLWEREPSLSGFYLVDLGEIDGDVTEEREAFNQGLRTLKKSLDQQVALADWIDDLEDDGPRGHYITFAPLFAPQSVNFRSAEFLFDLSEEEQEQALLDWLADAGLLHQGDLFGLPRDSGSHDRVSWLGSFNDRYFNHEVEQGWIRHDEHGWLYAAGTPSGGIWLWDDIQQKWIWTRRDVYPFFFSDGLVSWLFYEREPAGTPDERWFYFYNQAGTAGEWRVVQP